MKYLEDLNPQQKDAVLTTEGPMMILAGAGSGKTRTIIAKIIHLLKTKDVQPWEILAVTFSNRAANEMKERILKQLPEISPNSLQLSTFHAFCARVLRMQSQSIGLKSNFSIYDDSESTAVSKAILKRHEIDPKTMNPSSLNHFIDQLKNQGYYLGRKNFQVKKEILNDKHWPYFEEYEKELANNNAVDFGSLITKTLELFENNPQVLDYYCRKYKYLLVDEYQDTNKAQFDLIKLLSSKHENICVVGDSDQCLIKGTKISTPQGLVKIETLKVGDEVLVASSKFTKKTVKISRIHKNKINQDIIKITTSSGRILSSTQDHVHFAELNYNPNSLTLLTNGSHSLRFKTEYFTSNNLNFLYNQYYEITKKTNEILEESILLTNNSIKMTKAKDLKEGMVIVNENFEYETITKIEKVKYSGYVYDLDLPPYHNFIAEGIFTHNSIYSWRGAEIKNILDFEKSFPKAKILKLEENYRSSKNIIQAATEVIKRNIYRKDKTMFTNNLDGEKIKVYECLDGLREAQYVAQCINQLLKNKVSPKEIAVFYRTNSQSRSLEDGLRRFMIPYQVIGGLKFYERKEVKDVVAYLQVMMNPFDEISLLRVINTPTRGIGDKTISSLIEESRNNGLNLFDYLKITLSKNPKALGGAKAIAGLKSFVEIISEGQKMSVNNNSPAEIFDMIIEKTGYIEILKASKKYEDQARIENLQELKSSIVQFLTVSQDKTLTAYLETITLDRSEDNLDYGRVSLMTIHASKGLEFDHVFLVGVEENIFPSGQTSSEGLDRLEEERRLFYVAVTRARKELHIFYAKQRLQYGKIVFNPISRFLMELPKQYISKFRV